MGVSLNIWITEIYSEQTITANTLTPIGFKRSLNDHSTNMPVIISTLFNGPGLLSFGETPNGQLYVYTNIGGQYTFYLLYFLKRN